MTIRDVSVFEGPIYNPAVSSAGLGRGVEYTNWDANSLTSCDCDGGFFGADCSLVMCPKGDDPMTLNQNYRQILLTVSTSYSTMAGTLGVVFAGQRSELSLSNPSSSNCVIGMQMSTMIGSVGCVYTPATAQIYRFAISFYSFPTFPKENNFHTNDGNPSISQFYCDISQTNSDVTCIFSDITATNIIEYNYCSDRGICDFNKGLCACNDGFGGPACSNITNVYVGGSNALPGLQVNVQALDYVSSAIRVQTVKPPGPDFYLIDAGAGNQQVFSVRGDGLIQPNMLMVVGGATIEGGGLFVATGGVTILNDGLNVYSGDRTSGDTVASIQSTSAAALPSTFSALRVSTTSSPNTNHLLLDVRNIGVKQFTVRADGRTVISAGGLSVGGGATIGNGGLYVARSGVTISRDGLTVRERRHFVTCMDTMTHRITHPLMISL